jgi:tRNA(Ile)-lysidine synthase
MLPLLEARTKGAIHRLVSRAAQTVGADSQYSRFQARRWLNARRRRPSFARLHPAVQRQVIAEQLAALGIEPAYEAIERLRLLEDEPMATPGGTLSRNASGELTPVTAVARSFDQAEIELDLRPKAGTAEFARVRLEWRRRAVPRGWAVPPQVPGREFMDARCIGPRLILRHWRPGDRFQPIGLAKAAKLQDLFTNAKIPRDVRRLAVLACRPEGKIVWVEGIRLGDAVKVQPATRLILEWRWQRREE